VKKLLVISIVAIMGMYAFAEQLYTYIVDDKIVMDNLSAKITDSRYDFEINFYDSRCVTQLRIHVFKQHNYSSEYCVLIYPYGTMGVILYDYKIDMLSTTIFLAEHTTKFYTGFSHTFRIVKK